MSYEFGPYLLVPSERLLERDGDPVNIGSRAFDLLTVLVENGGEVVSKKDLHARVWPGVTVDEVSLRVHISGLRKVLGEASGGKQYITNVSGRGYAFSVPVRASSVLETPSAAQADTAANTLPPRLPRMVGRDQVVEEVTERLLQARFLSLVGPGGIGKTTIAVAAAHALRAKFDDGVIFVDLATITSDALVASSFANLVGVPVASPDPTSEITSILAKRRLLFVLDNCEHLIDPVASLAEHIFLKCPHVHLLATSRENLRVEGEHVLVVPPLDAPPEGYSGDPDRLLSYPAVRLFLDRAYASGGSREHSEEEIEVAANICRKLEGVALAIELVAGRAGTHGVLQMPELLDYRFGLYWQGRRTALPRHQTMAALHDWSYNLLGERERQVFRRLGWIVGEFTLEAAASVGGIPDVAEVSQLVESLADKSLLSRTFSAIGKQGYRMAETTRAYAMEKLQRLQAEELQAAALGHATFYLSEMESAVEGANTFRLTGTSAAHRTALPNIRLAMGWCYGRDETVELAVRLAAASAPMLLELSLLDECYRSASLALDRLPRELEGSIEEARLQQALAVSGIIVRSGHQEVSDAFSRALAIAERLDHDRMRLDILAGRNIFEMRSGDCYKGMEVAIEAQNIADESSSEARNLVRWMLGIGFAYSGDLHKAREQLEASCAGLSGQTAFNLCVFTQLIRAYVQYGRVLCLQGDGDAAKTYVYKATQEASAYGHPIPKCIAFAYAASVLIWLGDWEGASDLIAKLRNVAEGNSLAAFRAVSKGLEGELAVRMGHPASGVPLLGEALGIMRSENHHHMVVSFLAALAEGMAELGQSDAGAAILVEAIELAEKTGEKFQLPDMRRLQAVLALETGSEPLEVARGHLNAAWHLALEQGAVAFQRKASLTARRYPQLELVEHEQAIQQAEPDLSSEDTRCACS